MKKTGFFILILLISQVAIAQTYTPIDTATYGIRTKLSAEYLANSKQFEKDIKSEYRGGEGSYIKTRFERLHKQFNEDLLKGDYLLDARFSQIVDKVVTELKSKNQDIPEDLKFFISKDLSLNAASMGDRNFIINLGSFYYLDNEEQLASVLAHEIGHLQLKHSLKTAQKQFIIEKKESKKQLRELKNESDNKSEKALSKFKQILYEEGKFSRKYEYEADSIGFTLFKKTKYHLPEYVNTLKLIEQYDSIRPEGLAEKTYRRFFDLPAQAFKEEWMKREDFKSYDYTKFKEKINEDSVKSHPETDERIANIKRIFPELNMEDSASKASTEFAELQRTSKAEQPACLDYQEEYGRGIYLCLLRLQEEDNDSQYYKNWLGAFFNKIYDARKKYTLNRYLDRIEPKEQSDSYQQFLSFMWNLKLSEIKGIANYYNKKGS